MTYTRWGKSTCPKGTSLVYTGQIAGTHHSQTGGGANLVCLSMSPQFLSSTPGVQHGRGFLYGTQFQTGPPHRADTGPFSRVSQYNSPCAVCFSDQKATSIMIPGRTSCPSNWSFEYHGYLMSERYDNPHTGMFECFDSNPFIIGSQKGTYSLVYHVEVDCNHDIACPPYVAGKEITCVVCSK